MTIYVRASRIELYCSYCDYPATVAAPSGQLLTVADVVEAERRHARRHAVEEFAGEELGLLHPAGIPSTIRDRELRASGGVGRAGDGLSGVMSGFSVESELAEGPEDVASRVRRRSAA